MLIRELESLKGNDVALSDYTQGLNFLMRSGVLNALRAFGRPQRHKLGADQNVMASEGNYSAGWNDCLDALQEFKEKFLADSFNPSTAPKMSFGAVESLLDRGEITEEEANAIRRGDPVKYDISKFSGNITPPGPSNNKA